MRSTTAPDRRVFQSKLDGVRDLATEVGFVDTYAWLFTIAHAPGDVRKNAPRIPKPVGADDEDPPVRESDPTGELAVNSMKRYVRACLMEATREVDRADTALRAAQAKLRSAEKALDRDSESEHPYQTEQPAVDSWLHKGELTASLEAQERRMERGEGWGSG